MASSTVPWTGNTLWSPVMRRTFWTVCVGAARAKAPSRSRHFFRAPMSTPSAVESRNSTDPRLTTIRFRSRCRRSASSSLRRGAVYRSISPLASTTVQSPLSRDSTKRFMSDIEASLGGVERKASIGGRRVPRHRRHRPGPPRVRPRAPGGGCERGRPAGLPVRRHPGAPDRCRRGLFPAPVDRGCRRQHATDPHHAVDRRRRAGGLERCQPGPVAAGERRAEPGVAGDRGVGGPSDLRTAGRRAGPPDRQDGPASSRSRVSAEPQDEQARDALTPEEERSRELFGRLPDGAAREELVEVYRPLAEYLARRFYGRGEPLGELIQGGNIGLLKAIDRFDPDREVKFTTYATATIVGELKRHFRDKGWALRVPRRLQESGLKVGRAVTDLSQDLGRAPTVREIGHHTGLSEEEVLEAMETVHAYTTASLDAPTDEEGATSLDKLGEEDETFELLEAWTSVAPAIRDLPARERRILYLRFFRGLTQTQIAQEMHISQMHVSRLLSRTLRELREAVETEG